MTTKRIVKWAVIGVVGLVVLVVGGTWLYINVIREPAAAPLSFQGRDATTTTAAGPSISTTSAAPTSTAAATSPIAGTWASTGESQAGYRIKEVLFGQGTEAVGRTNAVEGQVVLDQTSVAAASFTIDLTRVSSDSSQRDGQYRSIMNLASFPTATFRLTAPIALSSVPADKEERTFKATGELTLRGQTRPVTFDLAARRNGANIEADGSIPVTFADFGIRNPSGGPATTEDDGLVEFLLVFSK